MPGFICEERLTAPSGDGKALERMLARNLKHAGFTQVEIVGGANDKGVDVVGLNEGKRWIFQVKCRNREYSGKGAEEVRNALTPYKADVAVLVTNTTFSESIYKYRNAQSDNGFDLYLWDGVTLLEYFNYLPDYSPEYKTPRDYQQEDIAAVERKRALSLFRCHGIRFTREGLSRFRFRTGFPFFRGGREERRCRRSSHFRFVFAFGAIRETRREQKK